jgi:hypothetical protein
MSDALLDAIGSLLLNVSEGERENVLRDLGAVRDRLRAGEYARTDFLARNRFDILRRTREFMSYMNGWARHAETWAAILGELPFDRIARVEDVCPGWAPKIEIALAQIGFGGALILVDRDVEAAERLREFMRVFRPRYRIAIHDEDFFAPSNVPLDRRADLVIANHAIDDLLIDRLAPNATKVYEDEAAICEAFRAIDSARQSALEEIAPRIAALLGARVREGGYLALAQYPSYVESVLDLGPGADVPRLTFLRVVAELEAHRFVRLEPSRALEALGPSAAFAHEHLALLERH